MVIADPYKILVIIQLLSSSGSGKKAKEKCEKIVVVSGDSNPGPMTLATSALTTELRQPSTSKTLTFFLYTVE